MRALPLLLSCLASPLAAQNAPPGFEIVPSISPDPQEITLACFGEAGPFEVRLWTRGLGPKHIHCVQRLDEDGRAYCAPQGGWQRPHIADGDPRDLWTLDSRVAARWDGPQVFAHAGPSRFVASYSEEGPPLALEIHGSTTWRMTLDLVSGEGTIFTAEGGTPFSCEAS